MTCVREDAETPLFKQNFTNWLNKDETTSLIRKRVTATGGMLGTIPWRYSGEFEYTLNQFQSRGLIQSRCTRRAPGKLRHLSMMDRARCKFGALKTLIWCLWRRNSTASSLVGTPMSSSTLTCSMGERTTLFISGRERWELMALKL